MKDRKSLTVAAAVLLGVPLVWFYFNRSLVIHILLVVWILGVIIGYLRIMNKRHERDKDLLMESLQRTASATLGHHRHDWMNDLQILYGYIALGKHDKLLQCVERIKDRMAEESKISKLGVPSLVYYLQSFREMNKSVQLEIHIEDDLCLGEILNEQAAQDLTHAIMDTIRVFQFAGRVSWGESLLLQMSIYREGGEAIVCFEQEDSQVNSDMLRQKIEETLEGKDVYVVQSGQDRPLYKLSVPCVNLKEVKACL